LNHRPDRLGNLQNKATQEQTDKLIRNGN
jgi:hypothetical protein